jgi:hypothetical protein
MRSARPAASTSGPSSAVGRAEPRVEHVPQLRDVLEQRGQRRDATSISAGTIGIHSKRMVESRDGDGDAAMFAFARGSVMMGQAPQ